MKSFSNTQVFKGIIQAAPSEENNGLVCVVIVLSDETEIPILHKGAGVDIIEHIGAEVELDAYYEETSAVEGGKALRVRLYKVNDGFEDPWYDDTDE